MDHYLKRKTNHNLGHNQPMYTKAATHTQNDVLALTHQHRLELFARIRFMTFLTYSVHLSMDLKLAKSVNEPRVPAIWRRCTNEQYLLSNAVENSTPITERNCTVFIKTPILLITNIKISLVDR